jgi:hypothetical protein
MVSGKQKIKRIHTEITIIGGQPKRKPAFRPGSFKLTEVAGATIKQTLTTCTISTTNSLT